MNAQQAESTAYHEAGHAVLATWIGAHVAEVSIDLHDECEDGHFGNTKVFWPRDAWPKERTILNQIHVALGGPAAEIAYTGDAFSLSRASEWRADWRTAMTLSRALRDHRVACEAFLEQVLHDVVAWVSEQARWAAIAAVADELLAHDTLEGEVVEDIVGFWKRR